MRLVLLILLLTIPGSPQAQLPLWKVHASTRSVTCLAPGRIGTTGGLRQANRLYYPGLAVRALSEHYVATDHGLYQGEERKTAEPTCALLETPQGLATGHASGRLVWGSTSYQLPTRAPVQALSWDGTTLYAGTLDGLYTPDGQRQELSQDPLSRTVTALLPDVAGTAGGVFVRTNGEWTRLGPPVEVTALARDKDGVLLVGTPDEGVFRQQDDTLVPMPGHPLGVSALLDTADGLVVGTPDGGAWCQGRGLYAWEGEIPGNQVMAVAVTARAVCAATFDNGLGMLGQAGWQRVSDSWVNQVASQGDGFLVRLSDGAVLDLGENRQLGRRDGWPKDWTSALGPGWVGTTSAFYLQDGARWQVFAPKPALQGAVVTSVARWRRSVWVGTQSGLFEVNPQTREARRVAGVNDSWITALAVYEGRLYVGTFSGGLSILGEGQVSPERIHCLLATPRGLWAGTPQGLLQVNRKRFLLAGQTVWCLAQRQDELWVGTDHGLLQTSQARLEGMPNSPSAHAGAVVDHLRGSAGAGLARSGLPLVVPVGGLPPAARPALAAFGSAFPGTRGGSAPRTAPPAFGGPRDDRAESPGQADRGTLP